MKKTRILLPIITVGTIVGSATTLVACAKKQEEEIKYLDVEIWCDYTTYVYGDFKWINKKDGEVIEVTSITGSFTGPDEGTFEPVNSTSLGTINSQLNSSGSSTIRINVKEGSISKTDVTYIAKLKVEFKISGVATTQNFEIEFINH